MCSPVKDVCDTDTDVIVAGTAASAVGVVEIAGDVRRRGGHGLQGTPRFNTLIPLASVAYQPRRQPRSVSLE